MAMGAADVVPGVSGGTIALITGIYQELIESIQSIDHNAVKTLFKKGPLAAWNQINGSFLLSVLTGIAISVLSLVKLIHFFLENYPVLIWAFFFGLILASAFVVGKQVKLWSTGPIVSIIIGAGIALWISLSTPAETPNDLWFIFLSGSIAICAMILPGISGSFILLLLRKYEYITGAIGELDFKVILTFGAGAILGLTAFSHFLGWLFKKFHDITIAVLTGFMIGSLNVVWPWKEVVETRVNSAGDIVPLLYESVFPNNFSGNANLFAACSLATIGIIFILLLERFGNKQLKQS